MYFVKQFEKFARFKICDIWHICSFRTVGGPNSLQYAHTQHNK